MKKTLILYLVAIIITTGSCDKNFEEINTDPNTSTEAGIVYLFTQGQLNSRLKPGYWDTYTIILEFMSTLTETSIGQNNSDIYAGITSNNWMQDHWNNYYLYCMPHFIEIERLYQLKPESEKASYKNIMAATKIMKAFNTSRATDSWGDIPYSEAFTARSNTPDYFPKYDTQEEIYTTILNDLESAYNDLSVSDDTQKELAGQDFLFNGDWSKWKMFANSLRFRLAMHLCKADPAKAEMIVKDVLTKKLPQGAEDDICMESVSGTDRSAKGNFCRACSERKDHLFGNKCIIDMMKKTSDPRLQLMYEKNSDGNYKGVPVSPDEQSAIDASSLNFDNYSQISTSTFCDNENLPGLVITYAEIAFLKSEAIIRGWAEGNAENEYKKALKASILTYERINQSGNNPLQPATEAEIDEFIKSEGIAFNNTMEQIGTQLWLHLGLMQVYEAYNSMRRLNFPVLPDVKVAGKVIPRPKRFVYPSNEILNNADNYSSQINYMKQNYGGGDDKNTRIWWDVD